jgi:cell division transport system permease protein
MRFFYVQRYFFNEAFSNLWANRFNNFVSIAIISFSLFTLGLFLLTAQNLNRFIGRWTENIQIGVFLNKNATQQDTAPLEALIKASPVIERYKYISKEEALKRFRSYYPGLSDMTDALSSNPFPHSYELVIRKEYQNKSRVQDLVNELRAKNIVDDVEYDQEWIERVQFMVRFVKLVGAIFGGILIFTATFSISNVIKLMVLTRRDEIEIMRLVGATNRFIKGPFLAEGIIHGLLGGVFAIVLLFVAYSLIMVKVSHLNAPFLSNAYFRFLSTSMIAAVVLGGMIVGFLGSIVSLRKLLRI